MIVPTHCRKCKRPTTKEDYRWYEGRIKTLDCKKCISDAINKLQKEKRKLLKQNNF